MSLSGTLAKTERSKEIQSYESNELMSRPNKTSNDGAVYDSLPSLVFELNSSFSISSLKMNYLRVLARLLARE